MNEKHKYVFPERGSHLASGAWKPPVTNRVLHCYYLKSDSFFTSFL